MLMVAALFYIDQRVRNEALDLEWAAHTDGATTQEKRAASPAYAAQTPRAYGDNAAVEPNAAAWNAPIDNLATTPIDAFPPQPTNASVTSSSFADSPAPQTSPATQTHATQILGEETPLSTGSVSNSSSDTAIPAQTKSATCAQCGANVSGSQTFCMNCGARLEPAGA
jgi:hypothetical protein